MSILKILLKAAAGIAINLRVVHSLPGRIRLHIPALCRMPAAWQVEKSTFSEILESMPSVLDVSWSYLTGNVLVKYDQEMVTEKEIVEGIKNIGKFLVGKRGELQGAGPEEMPSRIGKLARQFLEEKLQEVSLEDAIAR